MSNDGLNLKDLPRPGFDLGKFKQDPKDPDVSRAEHRVSQFVEHFGPLEPTDWPITVMLGGGEAWDSLPESGLGRMWTRNRKMYAYDGEPWGFGTGAYYVRKGLNRPMGPSDFPRKTFYGRLRRHLPDIHTPTVAIAPHLIGAGMESLEYSCEELETLHNAYDSLPWYLPIHRGMKRAAVSDRLDRFDGIALGIGEKVGAEARQWMKVAEEAAVPVHYSGCETINELQHAVQVGVDSLDTGGSLRRRPQKLGQFLNGCATYFFEEDAPLADHS